MFKLNLNYQIRYFVKIYRYMKCQVETMVQISNYSVFSNYFLISNAHTTGANMHYFETYKLKGSTA